VWAAPSEVEATAAGIGNPPGIRRAGPVLVSIASKFRPSVARRHCRIVRLRRWRHGAPNAGIGTGVSELFLRLLWRCAEAYGSQRDVVDEVIAAAAEAED
jgi:hypothetical protein